MLGPKTTTPPPFAPRRLAYTPPFIAQAAMDTGVARKPILDMDAYRVQLAQRLDPTAGFLQKISGAVHRDACKRRGLGTPILCGREELVLANMKAAGIDPAVAGIEIVNARKNHKTSA